MQTTLRPFSAGLAVVTLCSFLGGAHAQQSDSTTIGLQLKESGITAGYTLFTPLNSIWTYLIDNDGQEVHQWVDTDPGGNSVYLLEDGSLLRCSDTGSAEGGIMIAGGDGGSIRRFSWDNELLWDFEYSTIEDRLHHDIEPLPNGNVLAINWEFIDRVEALNNGRDPMNLSPDYDNSVWALSIIEIEPNGPTGGDIVWEWRIMDHLVQDYDFTKANYGVISENPRKVNFNQVRGPQGDWIHANSVDYDEINDQILISTPFLNEIWIIDHALTTEEAATEAGDLLYRWGNPANYGRGTAEDQINFFSHDARYVPSGFAGAGNITFFNNGNGRPDGNYSTIYEFTPPRNADGGFDVPETGAYGPEVGTVVYIADHPTDYYSSGLSGAERQPNGNTVICNGRGGVINEVDGQGNLIWQYSNPVRSSGPVAQGCEPGSVFRASRYPIDYPAFDQRDLDIVGPLELDRCLGDFDCSNTIGGADLTLFLSNWGASGITDLNGSGSTDGADLTLLLSGWGSCASSP
ncbi:MAG: hypothetical protein CBC35_10640 [Planctomycetes bacterium TMED75]|nr:hypothetical protein [Planctomycetaceae bacterium]OUU90858.1 MAG: hypothetical protein CBC35_10640 [Planctomycetes bacterium TMED75]